MADTLERPVAAALVTPAWHLPRAALLAVVAGLAAVLIASMGVTFRSAAPDAELLLESTPYKLALWTADQSQEAAPVAWLATLAKAANASEEGLLALAQNSIFVWACVVALLAGIGALGLASQTQWVHRALTAALVGVDGLLLLVPVVDDDRSLLLILGTSALLIGVLVLMPRRLPRMIGFIIAMSLLMWVWEASKALAATVDYKISVAQTAWTYTPYPTIEAALEALAAGNADAVFADTNDLETQMSPYTDNAEAANSVYPGLRYRIFPTDEQMLFFSLRPGLPGRLSVALPVAQAGDPRKASDLLGGRIATVAGSFADEKYLSLPREMVLLDLKILNDLNLPHLQAISAAFLQPARRNGEMLLVRILGEAGLYTWGEAVFGFTFGALLGFLLGTVFAHSRLMSRAFLPYVVASQTIPILAIAPMVVIWLGASPTSVAVIAVYITFFPVTVNTMRGLQSPSPSAVELMDSYAASRWATLWKLRVPAALPYIFTALKVSATASVVGAIIGELPSGIGAGLGRAILDFSSDYSQVSTPKLWAAIMTAALVGVSFFLIVSLIERVVLRRYIRERS